MLLSLEANIFYGNKLNISHLESPQYDVFNVQSIEHITIKTDWFCFTVKGNIIY